MFVKETTCNASPDPKDLQSICQKSNIKSQLPLLSQSPSSLLENCHY
jgi:hypothetical protein